MPACTARPYAASRHAAETSLPSRRRPGLALLLFFLATLPATFPTRRLRCIRPVAVISSLLESEIGLLARLELDSTRAQSHTRSLARRCSPPRCLVMSNTCHSSSHHGESQPCRWREIEMVGRCRRPLRRTRTTPGGRKREEQAGGRKLVSCYPPVPSYHLTITMQGCASLVALDGCRARSEMRIEDDPPHSA